MRANIARVCAIHSLLCLAFFCLTVCQADLPPEKNGKYIYADLSVSATKYLSYKLLLGDSSDSDLLFKMNLQPTTLFDKTIVVSQDCQTCVTN